MCCGSNRNYFVCVTVLEYVLKFRVNKLQTENCTASGSQIQV